MKILAILFGATLMVFSFAKHKLFGAGNMYNHKPSPQFAASHSIDRISSVQTVYAEPEEPLHETFIRTKEEIMSKHSSFLAKIYLIDPSGSMVFHCIGIMVSVSTVTTPAECSINSSDADKLRVIFQCHNLNSAMLPTDAFQLVLSRVVEVTAFGGLHTMLTIKPIRKLPSRCVILFALDDHNDKHDFEEEVEWVSFNSSDASLDRHLDTEDMSAIE